ncbi:MAG: LacI family transcriptional regulator [Hyphomicrobiales bacterium]|nr:MAG: LacI family transcriptional regulator [Hyphomicrobiales bacterium]
MHKPTTKDLAKAAGVSLATVDRVLNARAGVRPATAERVRQAIKEINFVRDFSAANLARKKDYQLVFLLPDHDDEFIDQIQKQIAGTSRVLTHERTKVSILRTSANDPHRVAKEIDNLSASQIDGVAIMAPETPQVRDAILRLHARGIAVVAFVSRQPNAKRTYYVGINNEAAGRTVGQLMARFTGQRHGTVLVLTETMQSRDSQERRHGFDAITAKYADRLTVGPSMETYGDPQRAEKIVKMALQSQPPMVGIYLMSHDILDIMHVIDDLGMAQRIVVIGHELTPFTRARLVDGSMDAVITQDVGHLVRSAIRMLRSKITGMDPLDSQERIRVEIIMRENMPEDA